MLVNIKQRVFETQERKLPRPANHLNIYIYISKNVSFQHKIKIAFKMRFTCIKHTGNPLKLILNLAEKSHFKDAQGVLE